MKKICVLLSAAVLAASLAACSAAPAVNETAAPSAEPEVTAIPAAEATVEPTAEPSAESAVEPVQNEDALYDAVLDKYRKALTEEWNVQDYEWEGMSYLTAITPADQVGFCRMDLDGDGREELIVGTGGEIFDLYTLNETGDTLISLCSASERDTYTYCEGNFIRNVGSSGADNSVDIYYAVKNGKLEPVRSLIFDTDSWYDCGTELDTANGTKITEEQANAIDAEYSPMVLELAPLQ